MASMSSRNIFYIRSLMLTQMYPSSQLLSSSVSSSLRTYLSSLAIEVCWCWKKVPSSTKSSKWWTTSIDSWMNWLSFWATFFDLYFLFALDVFLDLLVRLNLTGLPSSHSYDRDIVESLAKINSNEYEKRKWCFVTYLVLFLLGFFIHFVIIYSQ